MEIKTYYIVSCSYTAGVERWVQSIKQHGGKIQPIVIMYQEYFDVPDYFHVYKQEKPFPGIVERLFPVRDIIEKYGEEHWYVWSDCCDVILQRALPDLSKYNKEILVCSEQLLHQEAEFWDFIRTSKFFGSLLPQIIYNVGCFAMKGTFFKDYCYRLEEFSKMVNVQDGCLDQLFFNKWLGLQDYKCVDELFLCLYSTYTHGHRLWSGERMKLVRKVDGLYSINGNPYYMVHGNGFTKDLLDGIR